MESVAPQLQEKWEKYLGPDLALLQFFQRFRRFSASETKDWAITNSDCLTAEIIFMTLAESQQLKEPKTSFLPSTKRNALIIESCFRAILKGWVTCLQFVAQWVSFSAKRWRVGSLRRKGSSKPSENSPYFVSIVLSLREPSKPHHIIPYTSINSIKIRYELFIFSCCFRQRRTTCRTQKTQMTMLHGSLHVHETLQAFEARSGGLFVFFSPKVHKV